MGDATLESCGRTATITFTSTHIYFDGRITGIVSLSGDRFVLDICKKGVIWSRDELIALSDDIGDILERSKE